MKLITYGKTRNEAIELMKEAIANYKVKGIQTTLPFGKFVCEHEAFTSGNFDTHFVKKYYSKELLEETYKVEAEIAAKIALKAYLQEQQILKVPNN